MQTIQYVHNSNQFIHFLPSPHHSNPVCLCIPRQQKKKMYRNRNCSWNSLFSFPFPFPSSLLESYPTSDLCSSRPLCIFPPSYLCLPCCFHSCCGPHSFKFGNSVLPISKKKKDLVVDPGLVGKNYVPPF